MSGIYEFKNGSTSVFKFLEMTPTPPGPQARHTYLTRTNVDEASIYKDGLRGQLFTMQTTADSENETTGHALMRSYEANIGTVLEVFYLNVNYGKYFLDGVQSNGYQVAKLIGGVNHTDSKFFIESQWSLFPLNP